MKSGLDATPTATSRDSQDRRPDTQIDKDRSERERQRPAIRVDPIHNLLLIPTNAAVAATEARQVSSSIAAQRQREAEGDHRGSGQDRQPVRGLRSDRLLIAQQEHLELWKIPESGESMVEPLRIPAPLAGVG